MIVYIHSKCTTCQNALKFLEKRKSKVTVKDIVKEPPTVEELARMLKYKEGNIKKLLNTSGIQYREMGLSSKLATMEESEILKLLSENGMLIKRPFLLTETSGATGFKENEWLLATKL